MMDKGGQNVTPTTTRPAPPQGIGSKSHEEISVEAAIIGFSRGDQMRHQSRTRSLSSGTKEDVYTLDAGDAVLQWPEQLTTEEYEEINDWLDLMRRKLKRSVVDIDEGQDKSGE
jgi:hypothetical protein